MAGGSSLISGPVARTIDHLRALLVGDDVRRRLSPKRGEPGPALRNRRREPGVATVAHERALADGPTLASAEAYAANVENMIGTIKVPVGVIGPLRINGLHANGEFFVPLATTEAALVASYGRGADIASRRGGVTAAMRSEGVRRSAGFASAGRDHV